VLVVLVVTTLAAMVLYFGPPRSLLLDSTDTTRRGFPRDASLEACLRYPRQQSFHKYGPSSTRYNVILVADMDKTSKMDDKKWRSMLKGGTLLRNTQTNKYSISWESSLEIFSTYNDGSRGMELSELTFFNEQLLTFDDRTGIVYFIESEKVIPKHVITDGNGHVDKGLKIEWATVKDEHLYVGSTGKEWTTPTGEFVNNNPMWIARIDPEGRIERIDWSQHFTALRKATDTLFPGYLLHEAVRWNAACRRWFFLPRRVSKEPYDDTADEERGSNTLISLDEQFEDIQIATIGVLAIVRSIARVAYSFHVDLAGTQAYPRILLLPVPALP